MQQKSSKLGTIVEFLDWALVYCPCPFNDKEKIVAVIEIIVIVEMILKICYVLENVVISGPSPVQIWQIYYLPSKQNA